MKNKLFFKRVVDALCRLKMSKMLWKDISYKNLAKESGLSYRKFMKYLKFVRKKKLAKFSASVNYPLLRVFTAFVNVSLKNQGDSDEFKQRIKDLKFIQNIYFIGQKKVTFVLRLRCLTYPQLKEFTDILRSRTKDLILFTKTSIVCRTRLDEGNYYEKDVYNKKVELDKTDFEIIHQLQRNAHTPLSNIAKKVDLREPTIHRRIKKLKKNGVINGYHLIRKWERVPSDFWPVSAICSLMSSVDFDPADLFNLPSVRKKKIHLRYVYEAYGTNHILFGFSTSSIQTYRKFLFDELANRKKVLWVKPYPVLESYNKTLKFYPK